MRLPQALNRWGPVLLVLACLAASLLLALKLPSYRTDEDLYDELAWSLASNGSLAHVTASGPRPSLARPPGYPVFMGAVYLVAGHSKTAVRVAQAFLAAGTCWLAIMLGRRLTGSGLLAGVLLLATPYLVLYPRLLLSETLATFLMTLSVWLVLDGRPAWAGLTTGLLTLTRLQLGPVAPILALAARWPWRRVLVMGTVFLLAMSTWWVRNWLVTGRVVLTQASSIAESYDPQAFVPEGYFAWTATWMATEEQVKAWRFQVRPDVALLPPEVAVEEVAPLFQAMAARGSGVEPIHLLTPAEDEVFARLASERSSSMGASGWVGLWARRAWHLWVDFPRAHAIMEMRVPSGPSPRDLLTVSCFLYHPVVLAALPAALLCWREKALLPLVAALVYNTAVHAVFGVESRWLMYTWPLVCVLAGGLPWALARLRLESPPPP